MALLSSFLYFLKKRILFVLLIPVIVTASLSYVLVQKSVEIYEASSTVYLGISVDDSNRLYFDQFQAAQYLLKDYKELIKSKNMLEEVKRSLRAQEISPKKNSIIEMPYGEMLEMLTVSLRTDTRILEINCVGTDAEVCSILVNEVTKAFKQKAATLLKSDRIEIIEEADIPTAPLPDNNKLIIVMAFFLSFMSTIGVSAFLDCFTDRIIHPESLMDIKGIPLLGTIPRINTPNSIQKKTNSPLLNLCELESRKN